MLLERRSWEGRGRGEPSGSPSAVDAQKREPLAGGAGLRPAGAKETAKQRLHHATSRRLLKHRNNASALEEGAHGGTRGSPVIALAKTLANSLGHGLHLDHVAGGLAE
jgi:hypothetical protein